MGVENGQTKAVFQGAFIDVRVAEALSSPASRLCPTIGFLERQHAHDPECRYVHFSLYTQLSCLCFLAHFSLVYDVSCC